MIKIILKKLIKIERLTIKKKQLNYEVIDTYIS